jgi:hypothetical protein
MHAVLVHGWKGWPENAWFPWLRRELEQEGWTTEALKLPNPDVPHRKTWSDLVRAAIRDEHTVLIGHSLGCPTILFAIQDYEGPPIRGVVLVGGFARDYRVPGLNIWFHQALLDFDRIRSKSRNWTVIHSKNDLLVPYREGEWLARQLHAEFVTVNKGHMMHAERVTELPEALHAVLGV